MAGDATQAWYDIKGTLRALATQHRAGPFMLEVGHAVVGIGLLALDKSTAGRC